MSAIYPWEPGSPYAVPLAPPAGATRRVRAFVITRPPSHDAPRFVAGGEATRLTIAERFRWFRRGVKP